MLRHVEKRQSGSAALETLLITALVILPLWMLMFNMGYNGVRTRDAQNAIRLGAFLYIDGLAASDREDARKGAELAVENAIFKGETDPVKLAVTGTGSTPKDMPNLDSSVSGLFSQISFRQGVSISVSRTPPYDVFPSTPLQGSFIVSANTFTYCEMQDKDFNSGALGELARLASFLGNAALWLFGGYPGDGKDKCQ
jgi:hypothetical protein